MKQWKSTRWQNLGWLGAFPRLSEAKNVQIYLRWKQLNLICLDTFSNFFKRLGKIRQILVSIDSIHETFILNRFSRNGNIIDSAAIILLYLFKYPLRLRFSFTLFSWVIWRDWLICIWQLNNVFFTTKICILFICFLFILHWIVQGLSW